MTSGIDDPTIRTALARMTRRAAIELPAKQPHWGDAILSDGLTYAARALGEKAALAGAEEWFAPRLARGPKLEGWFWLWAAEALAALDLFDTTGNRDYRGYGNMILDHVRDRAPKTVDGACIPHPPSIEVWVDVSYFTAPAMAARARIETDRAALKWAADQTILHWRHLADAASGLFWHVGYPERAGHSQCLWARGNSWWSVAATQVLDEISRAGAVGELGESTPLIRTALARQLNAIIALQDKSGMWHTVIDRADSYLESSSGAGFALALGRAIRSNLAGVSANAERCYRRAIAALARNIDVGGAFVGVSQQTPPGDFAFYNSIEVATAPFGTGVCMMALAEYLEDAG
jgi:unsaturated rhamnogalacturonyl hydrolase